MNMIRDMHQYSMLGVAKLWLNKNTVILPSSHMGVLDDQVSSSLHIAALCPLSAYPSLHANSMMPNSTRELLTTVPFLGGASCEHLIAGEKRKKHEPAVNFLMVVCFLSK